MNGFSLRDLMPSMFHRRLLLIVAGMAAVFIILSVQVAYLTVIRGNELRLEAERALARRRILPTKRGNITDRYGRILATTRSGHDLAVNYKVLTGEWAYRKARWRAFKKHQNIWSELDETGREKLVADYEGEYLEATEQLYDELCTHTNLPRQELDDRIQAIKRDVNRLAAHIWNRRYAARVAAHEEAQQVAAERGEDAETFDETRVYKEVARPIGEQVMAHSLLNNVSQDARILFESRKIKAQKASRYDPESIWREIQVKVSRVRDYPLQYMTVSIDKSTFPMALREDKEVEVQVAGVATHIVGWQRDVQREDVASRPFQLPKLVMRRPKPAIDAQGASSQGQEDANDIDDMGDLGGYRSGDRVGSSGIEASFEEVLRGHRGLVTEYMDSKRQDRVNPIKGQDVRLAVDIRLQARIQAVMEPSMGLTRRQPWQLFDKEYGKIGEALNSAAVVLDVATGDILAAVSVPSFSLDQLKLDPASVMGDHINRPYLFRPTGGATGGIYMPGSTMKPFSMIAAITDGLYKCDHAENCRGHLYPDKKNSYRCWIYRAKYNFGSHGPLQGSEAIARSCNIYFYNIGLKMGPRRLVQWYNHFGFGNKPNSGLQESAGDLPKANLDDKHPHMQTYSGIFMAIGQGPIRLSVLQCANSYAMLARGGHAMAPRFVASHPVPEKLITPSAMGREAGIVIPTNAIDEVLEGMRQAVNERHGSVSYLSHNGKREKIFNIEGVDVYGKSGTAQAAPQRVDSNHDGRITGADKIIRKGDHSWVVSLMKKPEDATPRYVVVVAVEYGGSGGRISGPIVNQIGHALKAEGYF